MGEHDPNECSMGLDVQIRGRGDIHSVRCIRPKGHPDSHIGPSGTTWRQTAPRVRMPDSPTKCSCGNTFEDPDNMCMVSACQMET